MKKYLTILVAGLGVATSPALLAQGCCDGAAMKDGCSMGQNSMHGGHSAHALGADPTSVPKSVFMQPVQAVFDNYLRIQGVLTHDSIDGVSKTAGAMAKAIRGDSMQMLSPKVAEQADALAQARDLETARAAYKALSESLIKYVQAQKLPPGTYYQAYCPMAKASWLQTDKTILNPYMGKEMIHCGQIKS